MNFTNYFIVKIPKVWNNNMHHMHFLTNQFIELSHAKRKNLSDRINFCYSSALLDILGALFLHFVDHENTWQLVSYAHTWDNVYVYYFFLLVIKMLFSFEAKAQTHAVHTS